MRHTQNVISFLSLPSWVILTSYEKVQVTDHFILLILRLVSCFCFPQFHIFFFLQFAQVELELSTPIFLRQFLSNLICQEVSVSTTLADQRFNNASKNPQGTSLILFTSLSVSSKGMFIIHLTHTPTFLCFIFCKFTFFQYFPDSSHL